MEFGFRFIFKRTSPKIAGLGDFVVHFRFVFFNRSGFLFWYNIESDKLKKDEAVILPEKTNGLVGVCRRGRVVL